MTLTLAKVQDAAFQLLARQETIQNNELCAVLNVADRTLHGRLNELIARGVLVTFGKGRGVCYAAGPAAPAALQKPHLIARAKNIPATTGQAPQANPAPTVPGTPALRLGAVAPRSGQALSPVATALAPAPAPAALTAKQKLHALLAAAPVPPLVAPAPTAKQKLHAVLAAASHNLPPLTPPAQGNPNTPAPAAKSGRWARFGSALFLIVAELVFLAALRWFFGWTPDIAIVAAAAVLRIAWRCLPERWRLPIRNAAARIALASRALAGHLALWWGHRPFAPKPGEWGRDPFLWVALVIVCGALGALLWWSRCIASVVLASAFFLTAVAYRRKVVTT